MTTWESRLDDFYKKYKYNFIVQKLTEFPYPWLNYGTKEYQDFIKKEKYVSQREVFYDEMVFDIDMDKELSSMQARIEAEQVARIISERLKKDSISHTVWKTGGTGVHIHCVFPELFKLNSMDNRIIKKQFLLDYGRGFIKPREGSGKVQLQTNTTIQLEYAPHRKGGKKTRLWSILFGKENVLDKKFYDLLVEEKVRNDVLTRYYKEKTRGKVPKAIIFLENEQFKAYQDGRSRALFVLTAFYKQSLNEQQLFEKISKWNKEKLGGYFQDRQIRSTMRSAKPCFPVNYLIDLFDELSVPEQYFQDLKVK